MRKDPQGRTYYVDHNTKRTTWIRPVLSSSPPPTTVASPNLAVPARPVNPFDYTIYENRLNSFPRDWELRCPINSQRLAAAGFYFSKAPTKCKCYSCHLSIKSWKPNEDPRVKHKKYSSSCREVRSWGM